jgi:GTP-binding protein
MLPVIALVGRPNVGKSTLFNRLTRTRDALVASFPGLTRDRQYGKGAMGDFDFVVVDTGGLTGEDEGIDGPMAAQAMAAIEEADLVLFMVDATDGRMPGDENIATMLRQKGISALLVANKIDGQNPDFVSGEFFALGMGTPLFISASNGIGISQLIDDEVGPLLQSPTDPVEAPGNPGIKIAVVGRPNVGKSTLVNRLLGEDRVVVFDEAGTTRDSIYIPYERDGKPYTLIDTAGVRRRGRVSEKVEKFSVIKTLEAISDANVVILMLDAREGIVDQDLHLLSHVLDAGRALVIAINKWDGTDQEHKTKVRAELERRLVFIDFAKLHFISALHGSGVGNLYDSIHQAYRSATLKIPTAKLNEILERALFEHQPPLVRGRRIKLRYAHLGGSNPPVIVIHGNQTESVPEAYKRYLMRRFIDALGLKGTPLRLEFRTGSNPYKGRRNKLTDRQVNSRRRMMSHVKKSKKKRRT